MTERRVAALMSQPAPAIALFILVINDHLLKGAQLLPGALTGKLSDLAGLFFFPVLLCAALRVPPAIACVATGALFSALKLHAGVNALANRWWGAVALDPTDLVALLMLPLAWRWLTTSPRLPARRHLERAAIFVAAVASVATSAPPPPLFDQPRAYPAWQLAEGQRDAQLGCVQTHLWIARSGKLGVGLGVRAHNRCDGPRRLALRGELAIAADQRLSKPQRHPLNSQTWQLEPGQTERRYLPISFDNQLAWNEDRRVGLLSLRWEVSSADGADSAPLDQALLLHHLRAAPHRVRKLSPEGTMPAGALR